MNKEQDELKTIYLGYHPRSHDGSIPQTRSRSDAMAVVDDFNKKQGEGSLRAQLVEIACSDLCAVAIMETKISKVWQYI